MHDFPLLTALILVPFAGAAIAALVPRRHPEIARVVGYATSVVVAGMAVPLLTDFETGAEVARYQFTESHSWIGALGMRWTLGIDGISLFMVALTALLIPIGLLASAKVENAKAFTIWMLALEGAVIGVFSSLDLMMFFIFFEFSLIPMYFLIAGWGHSGRRYAAMKFFLFTMAGSAFLFVGILSVAFMRSTWLADRGLPGQLSFDVRLLKIGRAHV